MKLWLDSKSNNKIIAYMIKVWLPIVLGQGWGCVQEMILNKRQLDQNISYHKQVGVSVHYPNLIVPENFSLCIATCYCMCGNSITMCNHTLENVCIDLLVI